MKLRSHLISLVLGFSLLSLAAASAADGHASIPASTPPGAITVVPTPSTAGEGFGGAIALDGDTLVIGAVFADVGSNDKQGAAVIFVRGTDGAWQQVKRITASDGQATDGFGTAVAIDGDTVVVGAVYAEITAGETNQGAAYIFARNQGGANNWGQVKKIFGSQGDRLDNFGSALAVHGDDLFVAAANQGNGVVYRYVRNLDGADNWGEAQRLFDAEGRENDHYGSALAFDGATLVVGADRSDITGFAENDGAAFVYTYNATDDTWVQADKLSAGDVGDLSDNDRFGGAVALYGNVIAVGASNAEGADASIGAGKVYMFERTGDLWPQTAILTASDPTQGASFGQTVVATPQGIIVYGKQGSGVLYTYQPVTAQTAQSQAAWHETSRYAAEGTYFQSGYGRVLAADDARLAVGAPEFDQAKGGVYVYALEDVYATPPAVVTGVTHLPLLAFERPVLTITGQLTPGGKLVAADGAGIAAPLGSLAGPVNVSLLPAGTPATPHDDGVVPVGASYVLGADVAVSTPSTQPFILALPVGEGVDPAHLALAALVPSNTLLDGPQSDTPVWLYFEGAYDAPHQRFLATWPSLTPQGVTVALVQDPDFDALPAAQSANTNATAVKVRCIGFPFPNDCTAATEALVADYLAQINARMTTAGSFDFMDPRLRTLMDDLDFDTPSLAALGFTAFIENKARSACTENDGYYNQHSGRLVLCLNPGGTIGEQQLTTLIHEYFHATEFAYPAFLQDDNDGQSEKWLIEGMATAAEESYFLDDTMSHSDAWGIHDVDIPFDSDATTDEYRAQDFWVYVGQQMPGGSQNMGYLKYVLENGADKSAADDGLQHFNTNFKDQLWDWASNQVFEKENDLDGALGHACGLEDAALQNGIQYPWNLVPPPQLSVWPTDGTYMDVPPLTTIVVQLIFPCSSVAEGVGLIYPQCDGLTGDALTQCIKEAQKDLPAQMYEETGTGCFDATHGRVIDPEYGIVFFDNVARSRRYFAVATNVTDSNQSFKMASEIACAAP